MKISTASKIILLSGKSKLYEKRRINIENNRSPYLQCWPSWHESTCAVLPSDIDGVITWDAENRHSVPLPGFYTQSPVGRPHLVRSLRFIPESVFYTQSVMLFIPHSMFYTQSAVHSPCFILTVRYSSFQFLHVA